MYPRLLIAILLLLSACQSKKSETTTADSTATAIDTTTFIPPINTREEEQVISFAEFHSKYIKTKKIETISLPISFIDSYLGGTPVYESPEGAFESIPKRNGPVKVIGLLPDTSRFYGIVYALELAGPDTFEPSGYCSPRIATFSREGKFIARAEVITYSSFDGASSCGKADNTQHGFIDKDLSFYGMHALVYSCENEGMGRLRPVMANDMNYGKVSPDGTIFVVKENHTDQGDDNTPPFIGYSLLNEQALLAKMKSNVNLEANDLLAFFPSDDLRSQTEHWVWYSMRYLAEGKSIVAAVRRIKTDPGSRKRQYGVVVVNGDKRSEPYNFYVEDNREIPNEPDISILYDRMMLIITSTLDGKFVPEKVTLIPFYNNLSISLDQLAKADLIFERNWILAHNGVKFDSPALQAQYAKYDWYKPTVDKLNLDDLPYHDRLAIDQLDEALKSK